MNDRIEDRASITPVVFMAGVLGWLAISRPGNLDGETTAFQMTSTLASVAAAGYVSWRFHGFIAVIATLILFRFLDSTIPPHVAFVERGHEAMLLVTLWVGMVAGSRQGRDGNGPWWLILIFASAVSFFGWYGFGTPAPDDPVARVRITHLTIGLSVLAFLIGFLGATQTWSDRLKLFGVTIAVPAAGLVASRLIRGEWTQIHEGGDWKNLITEWRTAIDSGSFKRAKWAFPFPWFSIPFMLFGLWRAIARGRRQWELGRSPGAWLIFAAGLGSIVAIGARPVICDGSMLLAAIVAILGIFGVADFILSVVERIAHAARTGPLGRAASEMTSRHDDT